MKSKPKLNTARARSSCDPITQAPLVYLVIGGLQYASGINDGTLLALLQFDDWKMLCAVKHGDTIRLDSKVLAKKESGKFNCGRCHVPAPVHQAGWLGGASNDGDAHVQAVAEGLIRSAHMGR
jgi:acyl dehydratase